MNFLLPKEFVKAGHYPLTSLSFASNDSVTGFTMLLVMENGARSVYLAMEHVYLIFFLLIIFFCLQRLQLSKLELFQQC